ncbi:phage baseplate assembly protein V [Enterobacter roggenkampii]
MRQETRFKFNAYLTQLAKLNGISVDDVSKKFTVEPSVTQTLMNTVQASSAFLQTINILPVAEMKGEKIGVGVTGTIASTTDTSGDKERQTADFTALESNKYECNQINFDFHLTYKRLDLWARFQDFQRRIRDAIVQRQALDFIMAGFNGTTRADTSDRSKNPMLQDVAVGWLQKYRNEAPARVMSNITDADGNPAPSASADAWHVAFPDGAVIEYEPETGALTVSGIKTADVTASESITATVPLVLVKASTSITLDTPEVICTNKLTTATLEVQKGGKMSGNIEHSGGSLSSNGKVLHTHKHPGDSGGQTGAPL